MKGRIMRVGGTRRSRIPTRVIMPTSTPAAMAEIHKPTGTSVKKNHNTSIISNRGSAATNMLSIGNLLILQTVRLFLAPLLEFLQSLRLQLACWDPYTRPQKRRHTAHHRSLPFRQAGGVSMFCHAFRGETRDPAG